MKKGIVSALLCVMLLALVSVSAEVPHVALYADPAPPTAMTIDGVITAEEWGDPIATYGYDDVKRGGIEGWDIYKFIGETEELERQSVELYARRDSENLYFGFRLVNAHHIDYAYDGTGAWRYAGLKMAVGAFAPETNIETDENGERWLLFDFRPKYNESTETFSLDITTKGSIGLSSYKKPQAATFVDEDELCYNYEVVLPFADLYGVITADTEDVVLSFEIEDAFTAGKDSGNRWFISTAVRHATEGKDPQAFAKYNPLRLIYAEEPAPVVPETPEVPETPSEPPTDGFPWYLPVIAVVVITIVIVAVIVINKTKKEKQR